MEMNIQVTREDTLPKLLWTRRDFVFYTDNFLEIFLQTIIISKDTIIIGALLAIENTTKVNGGYKLRVNIPMPGSAAISIDLGNGDYLLVNKEPSRMEEYERIETYTVDRIANSLEEKIRKRFENPKGKIAIHIPQSAYIGKNEEDEASKTYYDCPIIACDRDSGGVLGITRLNLLYYEEILWQLYVLKNDLYRTRAANMNFTEVVKYLASR